MTALRLVILILFAVAADVSVPLAPEAMEAFEEEESTHRRRSHRFVRRVAEVVVPATVQPLSVTMMDSPRPVLIPVRPTFTAAIPRKAPPPATPPSSPEDH